MILSPWSAGVSPALRKLTALAALALCALSAVSQAPSWIPIAAARQRTVGATVSVLGTVTVPSGRFRSSSDDEGFAVQDATGGIWVSTRDDLHLKLGQLVAVTGVLQTKSGKLQIVPANRAAVTLHPGHELRVATGQIGAATAGRIITVEGTILAVTPDPPYGVKVSIDDGSGTVQVFLNASTDIDPNARHFRAGRIIRVTGFSSQYETTYEIEPRSRADIKVIR